MSNTKAQRVRRSADQWQKIFAAQAASGLSQTGFCQREGIALSTFARWKQRLDAQREAHSESVGGQPGWIELPSIEPSDSGWMIELDLGGGVCLRLKPA